MKICAHLTIFDIMAEDSQYLNTGLKPFKPRMFQPTSAAPTAFQPSKSGGELARAFVPPGAPSLPFAPRGGTSVASPVFKPPNMRPSFIPPGMSPPKPASSKAIKGAENAAINSLTKKIDNLCIAQKEQKTVFEGMLEQLKNLNQNITHISTHFFSSASSNTDYVIQLGVQVQTLMDKVASLEPYNTTTDTVTDDTITPTPHIIEDEHDDEEEDEEEE